MKIVRSISVVLCLLALLGTALPTEAQFTFTTNNGAITITGYNSAAGLNVVIPPATNGYPVTSLGFEAFYNGNLVSVIIPNSVTSIGNNAFNYCHNLTNAPLPNSITNLGRYAFSQCPSLTSVTLPNSLTTIGYGAFETCASLATVNLPNSVTTISDDAFAYCPSLTSVTIPSSVTNLGHIVFFGCSSLASIIFQGNAPTPGNDTTVFTGAPKAVAYYLPGTTGWLPTFDGIPTQLLSPPTLGLLSYSNRPVLIYPISGTNFTLQMTTNLANGPWIPVTNATPFIGVQVTNAPAAAFFRLH